LRAVSRRMGGFGGRLNNQLTAAILNNLKKRWMSRRLEAEQIFFARLVA